MTYIVKLPATRIITPDLSRLIEPFYFGSNVLKKAGLKWRIKIPTNFIMDWESIPLLRGRSPVSGLIHDYFSRSDSNPIITKIMAANIYYEMMCYRKTSFGFRNIKRLAVILAPGYFHAKTVLE